MPEYLRDDDGDVWTHVADDRWQCGGVELGLLVRADVERDFGPVTPCDADGEPLNPAPADDARALLAAAFEYHSTAAGLCSEVGVNPFGAGRLTAAALRSGEITT